MRHHTIRESAMSHIWMHHITHVNEWYADHACECVSHITQTNATITCTNESIISNTWIRHSTHVNKRYADHACECVSHVMQINTSYHICERVNDLTHEYVIAHMRMSGMPYNTCEWALQDSFIRVVLLIHTCAVTQSYMWHDSIIRVTWLIHMCET